MPTDKQDKRNGPDDRELSRLLNQTEPPKSPEHVDQYILNYARQHAPQGEAGGNRAGWLFSRPWTTAVATLSVAIVAVSVSLQMPREVLIEAPADFAESDFTLSVAQEAAAPATAVAEPALVNQAAVAQAELPAPARNDLTDEQRLERARQSITQPIAQPLVQSTDQSTAGTTAQAADDQAALTAAASTASNQAPGGARLARQASALGVAAEADALSDAAAATDDLPVLLDLLDLLESTLSDSDIDAIAERENQPDSATRIEQLLARFDGSNERDRESLARRYAERRQSRGELNTPADLEQAIALLRGLQN